MFALLVDRIEKFLTEFYFDSTVKDSSCLQICAVLYVGMTYLQMRLDQKGANETDQSLQRACKAFLTEISQGMTTKPQGC